MKIDLQQRDEGPPCRDPLREIQWKKSVPFALSPRGVLFHRVRYVRTYTRHGMYSHHCAEFWCGSIQHGVVFFADPPKDRLLCARCESIAVAHQRPTADELAGRHVCIGTMKVSRQCCLNTTN